MLGRAADRTDVIVGRSRSVDRLEYIDGYGPASERPSDRVRGSFHVQDGGEPGRT
jgi:hypothetical protein